MFVYRSAVEQHTGEHVRPGKERLHHADIDARRASLSTTVQPAVGVLVAMEIAVVEADSILQGRRGVLPRDSVFIQESVEAIFPEHPAS